MLLWEDQNYVCLKNRLKYLSKMGTKTSIRRMESQQWIESH